MTGERLNFIIAVSAILLSCASFYATYLQANSAEQQVKAMTWPLIEFTHGNYDTETREAHLQLQLRNAGVGPAIIKEVAFRYRGEDLPSLNAFLKTCCLEAYQTYNDVVKNADYKATDWTLTTEPASGVILPVGDEITFLSLLQHENNEALWSAVNRERWSLDMEVCYCSLL